MATAMPRHLVQLASVMISTAQPMSRLTTSSLLVAVGGVVEHSAILVVVEEVLADILKPLTTGLKRARLTA